MTDEEANQLMSQPPALKYPSKGMRNLGNTCFFNSVMQCITHTQPFLNYILSKKHVSTCNKRESCSLCLYSQYAITLDQSGKTQPMMIIDRLKKIWPMYRRGAQEDAHEFLLIFQESFINSCFSGIKPDRLMVNKNQQYTPIFKIFGGKSRSQVHCQGCGFKSNTYEDMISLSLDFPKQQQMNSFKNQRGGYGGGQSSISFESCLNEFCKSELLSGQNKYMCSNCKRKCDAKKRFSIDVSPRILIVHFKRFTNFGTKINTKVAYPSSFSLKSFMSASIDRMVDRQAGLDSKQSQQSYQVGDEVYDLFGVVIHQGGGCRSGHYYSYCKAPNKQWYNLNDECSSTSSEQAALSNQAYILFYQKRISDVKAVKNDQKKQSVDSSLLSQKSTSTSSSNTSERESNHHSDENKSDYVQLQRYSSVMPSNRETKRENTPQSQRDIQLEEQKVILKNVKAEEKNKENPDIKQKPKEEFKKPESVPSHIIRQQQPQPQNKESLNDTNYLKSLLGQSMKAHQQEYVQKSNNDKNHNVGQSDNNNKKEEIKRLLSDKSQLNEKAKQVNKDQKTEKKKKVKPVKSQTNLNRNSGLVDLSLLNISPVSFLPKQNLNQTMNDEMILQQLEQPQLVKSSSKSGSFTFGLRKSLHPVVINKNTKKRKLSAAQQLISQSSIKNLKRFKHNDDLKNQMKDQVISIK